MLRRFSALAVVVSIATCLNAQNAPDYDAFATASHSAGQKPGIAIFQVDSNQNLAYWQLHGPLVSNLPAQRYGLMGCVTSNCPYRSQQPDQTFGQALNVTPAVMPIDADNLFYAFVGRGSDSSRNGTLILGSVLDTSQYQSGQWQLGGRSGDLSILGTTPSVGGAILPDNPSQPSLWQANIALLAYATPDKVLHLDAWWVPQRGNGVTPFGASLATFNPSGTWDGNVSVAVRREATPEDTANPTPYGVYLATRDGNTINVGYAAMGQLIAEKNNPAPRFTWKTVDAPDGISGKTVSVQRAPDNRVFLWYLNNNGQLASFVIGGTAAAPTFTQLPPIPLPSRPTGMPSISYTLGDTTVTPGPGPNSLSSAKIPVFRDVFYPDPKFEGVTAQPGALISQYGYALRDVLPSVPSVQQTMVGIIEGPPPIPNENIAVTGPGNFSSLGYTRYGVENESSSDSTFAMQGGVLVQLSTEGGQEGGFDSEVDVKAGVGRTKSSENSTTSVATYEAEAQVIKDGTGKYRVAGSGIAFLYGAIYTGYRYRFTDANGNPIPGGAEHTEIFATSPQVRPYPFDLAEGGPYPRPGELMSYVVTPDQYNQLLANSNSMLTFKTPDTTSPLGIYFRWVEGGKYAEEANTLSSTSETKSWNVDVSALAGYGMHGDLGSWSAKAGDYLSIDSESTTSTSTGTGISTDVDFPAIAEETPNVYTQYGYTTIPFRGSADYATELVTYLRAHPSQNNNLLLKALVGNLDKPAPPIGTPWKIAYVIQMNDYMANEASGMRASAPGAPMSTIAPAGPPPQLRQIGIDSPKKAALLDLAVRDLKRPMMLKKAKVDPIPQDLRVMASRLNADQVQQLEQYLSTIQRAKYQEYRQRQPNKVERVFVPAKRLVPPAGPTRTQLKATRPRPIDFAAMSRRGDVLKSKPYQPVRKTATQK